MMIRRAPLFDIYAWNRGHAMCAAFGFKSYFSTTLRCLSECFSQGELRTYAWDYIYFLK